MSNEDDLIRDNIMRSLYSIHKDSKSINTIAKGQKELYEIIRENHDYKEKIISHHLDYLIQKGWVSKEKEIKTFTKGGISREQIKNKFKISDIGIEKYENGSAFHHIKNDSLINITSIDSVIIAGNGNVVNASYSSLSQKLEEFQKSVSNSNELNEEQKLNTISDITTIQNQLSKSNPNKSIIEQAWLGLQFISTIPGLVTIYNQLSSIIHKLF